MNREEALALVKRNYWKAACPSLLNDVSASACVVTDMDGSLRLFNGKTTILLEQFKVMYPETWKRTENERWGICP